MVANFCINIAIIDLAAVYLNFRASVVESTAALTCSVCTNTFQLYSASRCVQVIAGLVTKRPYFERP